MRIYFSVGEPSGDLHASNLIRHLKSHDPSIECVGYGGPKMKAAGCEIHYDLTQLAVMFIWEALKKLRFFFSLVDRADEYFESNSVDAVVLIDYSGFNWWIAKKAKKRGIPVFYYGVPQVWAWGPWRIRKIRKYVDHVLCKLPFEESWFSKRNCRATYVGHPYFDQLQGQEYDDAFLSDLKQDGRRMLTLLPGSRNQEVKNNLPTLAEAATIVVEQIPGLRVAVACYNQHQLELARQIIAELPPEEVNSSAIELFVERTPELMKSSEVCLACSGSVSLELMYHRKPTVIVYKTSRMVMLAQSVMLRTRFITLVNLIGANSIKANSWRAYDPDAPDAEPAVMPEYLTCGNRATQAAAHLINWLSDESKLNEKKEWLDRLAVEYAKPGATRRAAEYLMAELGIEFRRNANDSQEQPALDQTERAA